MSMLHADRGVKRGANCLLFVLPGHWPLLLFVDEQRLPSRYIQGQVEVLFTFNRLFLKPLKFNFIHPMK